MQEELALALGSVAGCAVAVLVGADVAAAEPELARGLMQYASAIEAQSLTERFHLGARPAARPHSSSMEELELVPGLPVVGNDLGALGLRHG